MRDLVTIMKQFLKKILPPPTASFNREVEHILTAMQSNHQDLSKIHEENVRLRREIAALKQEVSDLKGSKARLTEGIRLQTNQTNRMLAERKTAEDTLLKDLKGRQSEVLWGEIFRDTIVNSIWLKDKSFSPGRWAAGYPFLYALYRVLDEARPKRILELGLGQTTRMIGQYASAFEDVQHIVIEHDPEWIAFFKRSFSFGERTTLLQLPLEESAYLEDNKVLSYKGFTDALEGKSFDLISIDGPFGGNAKIYSRVDVLRLFPNCLMDSFAVLLDDFDRLGERRTMAKMELNLKDHGIAYHVGRFVGQKETRILTSENWKFLCSM